MNIVRIILILAITWLVVFAGAVVDLRPWLRAQPDLLPGLMVYVSLSAGPWTVAATALAGGLLFDSLSASPLGLSVLPLVLCGLAIQQLRHLVLRQEAYAQLMLGGATTVVCHAMALGFLLFIGKEPMLGPGTVWQLGVLGVVGGLVTPLWFRIFDLLDRLFNYQPVPEAAARDQREIKYGR